MRAAIKQIRLNCSTAAGERPGALQIHTMAVKPPLLRHGRWSSAIANKRGLLVPGSTWHPEKFTFWLGASARRAPQLGLRPLLQLHFSANIRNVFPAPASRVYEQTAGGGMRFQRGPLTVRRSQGVDHAASPDSIMRTGKLPLRGESGALRLFGALRLVELHSFSPIFSNVVFARERLLTRLLRSRIAEDANDEKPSAIAKRIGQKARRVESGHIPVPRDLLAKRAGIFSSSDSLESGGGPLRSATNGNETYRKTPEAIVPPMDLKKVTDEVMQQIDRRIVANRERFGKI
ncbi:MAG TPA: hypothetical protein VK525_12745 [Candidatus Saccharimonadales bacterium]|nr:hypothetical protein [Candidatus Saccharimonadales bacterium]